MISTSSDGFTWTDIVSPTNRNLRKVIWNGERFIAVGDLGVILTSSDGITWEKNDSGTTSSLFGIATNDKRIIVVGLGMVLYSDRKNTEASISSTKYIIDNIAFTINNVDNAIDLNTSILNINPSPGANVKIYQSNGTAEVVSGKIVTDMKLKVTAEDGKTTNTYTIVTKNGTEDINNDNKISNEDAEIMKNYLLGTMMSNSSIVLINGDLDCDSKITSKDYALLLRLIR